MRHADPVAHCLAEPGAVPDEPWEGDLVAEVGGRVFAFLGGDGLGVKCGRDADEAAEPRELVDASYDAVVATLPRRLRP